MIAKDTNTLMPYFQDSDYRQYQYMQLLPKFERTTIHSPKLSLFDFMVCVSLNIFLICHSFNRSYALNVPPVLLTILVLVSTISKLEMCNNGSFRSGALSSFRSGNSSPSLQICNLAKPADIY